MNVNVRRVPGPGEGRRSQSERSQATRGALIETARRLFAERGYANVGTEEIVRAAGVTRGALYHHFADKRDLFEAVYSQLEAELTERIAAGALEANADSPLAAMRAGAEMFLEACAEPEAKQIALLDGPAVLGWDRWREIGAQHGLGLIEATLRAAVEAGAIESQPVRPLAHVLMGALDEAALMVATAEEPSKARAELARTLAFVIDSLSSGARPR